MIRTVLIPLGILSTFLRGAATLMATAPTLTPDLWPHAIDRACDRRTATNESDRDLSGHRHLNRELIPEVSGKIEWMSDSLVWAAFLIRAMNSFGWKMDYEPRWLREAALLRAEAELNIQV